ncbi:MAG: hypothetical protein MZV63_31360 [Marinilabiliales bacterium]|nr:hypothetical protein [Marinilabiliales bacterium]
MLHQFMVIFKDLILFVYLSYNIRDTFVVVPVAEQVTGIRITVKEKIEIVFFLLADSAEIYLRNICPSAFRYSSARSAVSAVNFPGCKFLLYLAKGSMSGLLADSLIISLAIT